MNNTGTKVVKHGSTLAPFECEHCERTWYGWYATHQHAPKTCLCTKCWNALDTHIWNKYQKVELPIKEDERVEAISVAQVWIQNKAPRTPLHRFHASVPQWMRTAIMSGLVKTNGDDAYVVFTCGQEVVKVEIVDRSSLKPFKIK